MYIFIFFISFIKHAQILLSRKFFSSFLSFFFFFQSGAQNQRGIFPKTEKKWPNHKKTIPDKTRFTPEMGFGCRTISLDIPLVLPGHHRKSRMPQSSPNILVLFYMKQN